MRTTAHLKEAEEEACGQREKYYVLGDIQEWRIVRRPVGRESGNNMCKVWGTYREWSI